MTFTFYQYKDDKKRVDKTNYLGTALATKNNCIFKDSEDKGTPQLELAYDANIKDANYVYIQELAAYYYLNEPIMAGQRFIFNATKDLLMSEKDNILNLECIVSRQQNAYNAYLNDSRLPIMNRQKVNTLPFPSGFADRTQDSIILVVNGG